MKAKKKAAQAKPMKRGPKATYKRPEAASKQAVETMRARNAPQTISLPQRVIDTIREALGSTPQSNLPAQQALNLNIGEFCLLACERPIFGQQITRLKATNRAPKGLKFETKQAVAVVGGSFPVKCLFVKRVA